jgi:hypothetical protein
MSAKALESAQALADLLGMTDETPEHERAQAPAPPKHEASTQSDLHADKRGSSRPPPRTGGPTGAE